MRILTENILLLNTNKLQMMDIVISFVATIVTIVSVVLALYYNHMTRKEYLESLKPVLSFRLFEHNDILHLKITNMGKSAAIGINVDIIRMENNEYNIIDEENMFVYNKFELYPTEEIEAMIGTLETKLLTEHPIVYIEVSYTEKNSNKKQKYGRTVICCNRKYE